MKLPKKLFPRVELSPEQCAAYEKLTEGVVSQAMREYDDFNYTRGRQLDRKRWKQIRKCDDITVYSERASYIAKVGGSSGLSYSSGSQDSGSRSAPSTLTRTKSTFAGSRADSAVDDEYSEAEDDLHDASVINSPVSKISTAAVSSISETEVVSTSKKDRAPLPKLLAVGRVAGVVEDMILGILTPTPTISRMKEAYINDEIADCKVLFMLKHATPDDPLRFLGLKWIIKAHSPILGTMVRQRDMVFIESLGMRTREDGSRFGYFVMHSVEVPECGELTQYSIVRARISLVYILTQSSSGQVDVFMKTYIELNGSLPDSVGLRTMANSLMTVALTNIGGHKRKMGWAATKKMRTPSRSAAPPLLANESNCSNCKKSFSLLSSGTACYFCATRVCSKCYEQHELAVPNPDAKTSSSAKLVRKMWIPTCTRCYSTVFRNVKAEDVAREEVLAGEYGEVPRDYGKAKQSAPSPAQSLHVADLRNLSIAGKQSAATSSRVEQQRWQHQQEHHHQQHEPVIELDREDFVRSQGVAYHGAPVVPHAMAPYQRAGYHEQSLAAYPGAPASHLTYAGQSQLNYGVAPPLAPQPSNEDLYARIAKLHQTAEHVYQYTKRTTDNALGPDAPLMPDHH